MSNKRIVALSIVALLGSMPIMSVAASFKCAAANSPIESMICADRQLSTMDDHLAALFRAAKAVAPDAVARGAQSVGS